MASKKVKWIKPVYDEAGNVTGYKARVQPGGRNGKKQQLTFVRWQDAYDWGLKLIVDFQRNKHLGVPTTATFGSLCDNYWKNYAMPNNQLHDFYKIKFFRQIIGEGTKSDTIKEPLLKGVFATMTQKMEPASVIRYWTILQGIFRENRDHFPNNPAKGIISKKIRKQASRSNTARRRFFTDAETFKIYDALLGEWSGYTREDKLEHLCYAQVARNTGMRPISIEKLEWSDIDFERGTIFARETKNGRSYTFPLNHAAKLALEDLRRMKHYPEYGKVFRSADYDRMFTKIFRDFGWNDSHLPDNQRKIADRDQATLYTFRHTFASHLVMAGVTGKPLWELMGWENGSEEATYAHLSPQFKQKIADVVSLEYKVPEAELRGHLVANSSENT